MSGQDQAHRDDKAMSERDILDLAAIRAEAFEEAERVIASIFIQAQDTEWDEGVNYARRLYKKAMQDRAMAARREQRPAPSENILDPVAIRRDALQEAVEAVQWFVNVKNFTAADVIARISKLALQPVSSRLMPSPQKGGIYIASKVKHAHRWRYLRDAVGYPIISTWIDEAGEGESSDLSDLWRRCIDEASTAGTLIVYREPGEILKGAWIELGAALASGKTVFAIGIEEYTVAKDKRIRHFSEMKEAIEAWRSLPVSEQSMPSPEGKP